MGALIGGVYAAGGLDAYTDWVSALQRRDVVRMLDLSWSRNSLFKGDRIIKILRELIGDHKIESLPVAFTAVATDLDAGREVWLRHGSLFDAIHASIAIPTIFAPVRAGGRLLVDGGLINPVPIAPTLNDTTDLTVVINVNAKSEFTAETLPPTQPAQGTQRRYRAAIGRFLEDAGGDTGVAESDEHSLFDVISRAMDTMQSTIARQRLAAYSPDAIVEIPRNVCAFHEFHRAGELIAVGHQMAHTALARFAQRTP